MADLRLGRWQDVLADVREVDALIFDGPFSPRTHTGARQTRRDRAPDGGYKRIGGIERTKSDGSMLAKMRAEDGIAPTYPPLTPRDVRDFVQHWHPRTRGWFVAMTDSDLVPHWRSQLERVGRQTFQPLPCLMPGMSVRLGGDGPSSWAVHLVVARPRTKEFHKWGTLPGGYYGHADPTASAGRGKPFWLMSALVRDYSRPGDLVCDPFAGWGSTLAAAISLGRRAIGSEMDPEAYAEAMRRLARPLQVDLFAGTGAA